MTRLRRLLAAAGGLWLLGTHPALAQSLDITWYTVDGGGATFSTGGTYSLGGTIGQPDASGPLAGGTFSLVGGFWGVAGVTVEADLSVTKTDGLASAVPGQSITYTIVVSNSGPGNVTGATVADAPPAAITSLSWTCVAAGGGACAANGTGAINDTVNLPSGATVTYTLAGTIAASATGSLVNTASVTTPAGILDPDLANNSATDTDTLTPQADLSVTKTDGRATTFPGQAITYTIVVANVGPSSAPAATVTDAIPTGLTGATWTCAGVGGGTCTAGGSGTIGDTVALPAGASVTYTLSGTVGASATGSLINTATVGAPSGVADLAPANNSATDTDAIDSCPPTVEVVPDGRLTATTIGAGATAWFGASLRIGNSYSLEFKSTTALTAPGVLTVFSGDDGCVANTLVTRDTALVEPQAGVGMARASFEATGTSTHFHARVVNGSGGAIPLTFGWADTTLFSPAWSDNGTFDTFYSFQNTTDSSLTGSLTLLDPAGALVKTVDLTLPAGQTLSTNTGALAIARNRTGTARFTHDGPPGAVVAEAAIANFLINPAYVQPVKFQAVREAR